MDAGFQVETSAIRHGVDGVRDEVVDDLAQLAGENLHMGFTFIMPDDFDSGLLQLAGEGFASRVQQFIDGHNNGLQGLAQRRQGLPGDGREAVEFVHSHGDQILLMLARGGFRLKHEQDVGDRIERIVDLMRQAGQ